MKKSLLHILFFSIVIGVSGCEKSAQEKLAERILRETEQANAARAAYLKKMDDSLKRAKEQRDQEKREQGK